MIEGVIHRDDEESSSRSSSSTTSWERLLKPQLTQRIGDLVPKTISNQTEGERETLTELQRELMATFLRYVPCQSRITRKEESRRRVTAGAVCLLIQVVGIFKDSYSKVVENDKK